jgi:hypothetical protein
MNKARMNSFRVNGTCELTLNFGAISVLSSDPLGYSILRADGTIYNFSTGAWESLSPTGQPTGDQVRALSRFAKSGPLANQQYGAVPASVFSNSGVWFATFQLNANGSIVCQVDDYPCLPELITK